MRVQSTIRRVSVAAVIAGTVTVGAAAPALADHDHSKELGNGDCVILAQNGGESRVELPSTVADPLTYAEGKRHPLHVLVHKGRPSDNFVMGVYLSTMDPCVISGGNYVNVHD